MRAGRLDRRITLQSVTRTQDAAGQAIESWADLATCWAEVRPVRGAEAVAGGERQATSLREFRIRWREGVTPQYRIVFEARNYDIRDVQEIGRREGLLLIAEARAD